MTECTSEGRSDCSPSEMISTTLSPPTALSMKSARKRSCSDVEPVLLSSVERSDAIWVAEASIDILEALKSMSDAVYTELQCAEKWTRRK